MDYKKLEESVKGMESAIDTKMAGFESQITELKNAFAGLGQTPEQKKQEPDYKGFLEYARSGTKAASMTNATGNATEVVVPEYTQIYAKMRDDNDILRIVNNINIAGHNSLAIPVDVNEPTTSIIAEGGAKGLDNATVDLKTITLAKYMCKVGISYEMLNAYEPIDFYNYLFGQVADSVGRKQAETVVTTITGDSDLDTVTSANATKVTGADILDLMAQAPQKAHANGKFVMNSATFYKLMKEYGGQEWFTVPYKEGISPSIYGHEVCFAEKLDAPAATKTTVLYGDFQHAVTAVQANGINMSRDDFTGADNGLVYLRAYSLFNAGLVRPESIVGLKQKAS